MNMPDKTSDIFGDSINRFDIIQKLAEFFPDSKTARLAVFKTFEIIEDALKNNKKVVISNFGTFIPKEIVPKKMRNPKTGEQVITQSRLAVRFHPAKNLMKIRQ